jgi:FlaA1/EpsC-like NDP-sugar epimerase
MTIPEAAQLVLQSGAMAKNGELFVLDMGQPVRMYDLAENMILLSGAKGIEIVEVGLRPGEKLYEELLMTDHLEKTENELIFIEREVPPTCEEIKEKLNVLQKACDTNDDETVKNALKAVVPTYKEAEARNR